MAEEKEITLDELRGYIGKAEKVEVVEIEKGLIRRFAEAIGDPNPLWQDEEYAKKTKYGGIIAPAELLVSSEFSSGVRVAEKLPLPAKRIIAGGADWEFYQPIRAGDVITTTHTLVDVYERQSKSGEKMTFLIFDSIHKNQRGEAVGKSRSTIINM